MNPALSRQLRTLVSAAKISSSLSPLPPQVYKVFFPLLSLSLFFSLFLVSHLKAEYAPPLEKSHQTMMTTFPGLWIALSWLTLSPFVTRTWEMDTQHTQHKDRKASGNTLNIPNKKKKCLKAQSLRSLIYLFPKVLFYLFVVVARIVCHLSAGHGGCSDGKRLVHYTWRY